MKKYIFLVLLIMTFGCNTKQSENEENSFPVLTGKYLGQTEPGLTPELFAPNIISTGMSEINATFSPDYKAFYYSTRLKSGQLVILELKYNGTQWSEPEVASFSSEYGDADPFITYDGEWLYFISRRPADSLKTPKTDWDIWRAHKIENGWSEPERLSSEINSPTSETYPTLTRNGKLYFASSRDNPLNNDIYYANKKDDDFETPVRLNDTVNSPHREGDIFISADEDYMIFASSGRESGSGLYITFNENGIWSIPQRMKDNINLNGSEFCPIVSPDGNYFFFTSSYIDNSNKPEGKQTYKQILEEYNKSHVTPQMGGSDIYWVSSGIIEEYKSKSR